MPRPSPSLRFVSRSQRGFTLVELMVAMVVSSIVVLGIFAFSTIQQHTSDIHERHVRVQRALEGAMWSISQDVHGAGLGWTRFCTEIRIWDAENDILVNPGAIVDPTAPDANQLDPTTGEPYWVLRDGLQVFWHSDGITDLDGTASTSADPSSAADAFDVLVSEANYVESTGIFATSSAQIDTTAFTVTVSTNAATLPPSELEEVQQLFPPGSFILLVRQPAGALPVHPTVQGQCVLLQVTADVTSAGGGDWTINVDPTVSGFNEGLNFATPSPLLTDDAFVPADCNAGCGAVDDDGSGDDHCGVTDDDDGDDDTDDLTTVDCDDWVGIENDEFSWVVPLGRVRWSRYEIDYTVPQQPYLVRYDIIDAQNGEEVTGVGTYPHCTGDCPMPQLHLFSNSSAPPEAVAIAPMVEDMQIAVACDGYTTAEAGNALFPIPSPDNGFDETVQYSVPDGVIDEQTVASNDRDTDEWVGNSDDEEWAPDCVYWGTAEYRKEDWQTWYTANFASDAGFTFRLHPQMLRVSLTGSAEFDEESGSLATTQIPAIEDRPAVTSPVGARTRFTVTESFTPPNLRWRDPSIY